MHMHAGQPEARGYARFERDTISLRLPGQEIVPPRAEDLEIVELRLGRAIPAPYRRSPQLTAFWPGLRGLALQAQLSRPRLVAGLCMCTRDDETTRRAGGLLWACGGGLWGVCGAAVVALYGIEGCVSRATSPT